MKKETMKKQLKGKIVGKRRKKRSQTVKIKEMRLCLAPLCDDGQKSI